MKNLEIKETKYTPEINFNAQKAELLIKGSSYPENTVDFYEPILIWLEEFFKFTAIKNVTLNIEINYFNSSSSRVFFEIFDLVEENSNNLKISINWIYDEDNESILEIGEDYKLDFEGINFNLVKR